jgi:hypothetical protein
MPNLVFLEKWSYMYILCVVHEFLDRRKMTEWGSLAQVDEGQGDVDGKSLSLPGVRKGDMSSRNWKPDVRVSSVRFSPTGKASSAVTNFLIFVIAYSKFQFCQISVF